MTRKFSILYFLISKRQMADLYNKYLKRMKSNPKLKASARPSVGACPTTSVVTVNWTAAGIVSPVRNQGI